MSKGGGMTNRDERHELNGEKRRDPHLAGRTGQVVKTLATKVRVMTLEQVAENWFSDLARPKNAAREGLHRAEKEGLLVTAWGMAHPTVPLPGPLYRYEANDRTPPPLFGRLSWEARRRFRKAPVRTLYVTAAKLGKAAFGQSPGRRSGRTSELTHDIHVAEVYLRFLKLDSEREREWRGEDHLQGSVIRPDAVIGDTAIDFIGKYSASKIESLHRQYIGAGIRVFEFW
jgi:hypothetical protein